MKTFYEFFAGGGMARSGLGSGWQCLFANDVCEKKAASYRDNWGGDDLVVGDVFGVRAHQLPGRADLAWGSFPCQDLSLAGAGRGLDGNHSGAFWGFWNVVRGLSAEGRKPRIVVLENVFGALTSHDGRDFEQIATALANGGYVLGAMVVDAVHFTPHSRPRLFVIGVAGDLDRPSDLCADGPTPTWHPDAVIRAFNRLPREVQAVWQWWNPPTPVARVGTLDEIIEAEPTGVHWNSDEATQMLLSMMTDVHRRKVLHAQRFGALKVGTIYKRTRCGIQRAEVRFDGVAGCLRTPAGGSSRQTIMVVEGANIRTRLISPREAARLMGLPDSYRLPARYNDAYQLLGDGVVVPVVAHLSEHLFLPILNDIQSKARCSVEMRQMA